MKISLLFQNHVLPATVVDGPTARDFLSLLPLKVKMADLFGREKYGPLPRRISQAGSHSDTYQVGDIGYWSPGNEIAIYYKEDDEKIPSPGIILIGKLDSDGKIFDVPGSVEVTIERQSK